MVTTVGSRMLFEDVQGVGFITLRGEHDAYSAPRLSRLIRELLVDATPVVVDLETTVFVDSVIVGVLMGCHEHAREVGRPFLVLLGEGTGRSVHMLFQLTGLGSMLDVVRSRPEALERLVAAPA